MLFCRNEMNKVYLVLLLITIIIFIIIITLAAAIKISKNKEHFTTEDIEKLLNIPTDVDIEKHENRNDVHDQNKNASVGDIIFMSKEGDKVITAYGCEYLPIKNNLTFDFIKPKYAEFIDKFLEGVEGKYTIRLNDSAIGSSTDSSFKPEHSIRNNTIIFNKVGEDGVVELKDVMINSDEIFNSTAIAPYFFTRSQTKNIETPWLEKAMEIKADVDIKSLLPKGKIYLYVCISTKSE